MEDKIPLYHKVYYYVLDKIKEEYRPGDLLPTQSEIAKETDTSLITVKRAIKELETAGFVESKAGKGTTVRKPQIIDSHVGVSSWTDSISAQGNIPSTAWTKIYISQPSSAVADALRLKAREKIVVIERLRLIDGKPICLMTNILAQNLVPGFDKNTQLNESLYTYLKDEYGLIGASADEEVYAREAKKHEIETLELKTPIVLAIDRASFLLDKTPFGLSTIIAAAESYVYRSHQINKTLDQEVLKDLLMITN